MSMTKDVDPVDASQWTGNGAAHREANRAIEIKIPGVVLTASALSAAKAAGGGQWIVGVLILVVGTTLALVWRRWRA